MARKDGNKPVMPAGCWQVPLAMLVGGLMLALLGDHFWWFGLFGAVLSMLADLVRSKISPFTRIAQRPFEYLLLAGLATYSLIQLL